MIGKLFHVAAVSAALIVPVTMLATPASAQVPYVPCSPYVGGQCGRDPFIGLFGTQIGGYGQPLPPYNLAPAVNGYGLGGQYGYGYNPGYGYGGVPMPYGTPYGGAVVGGGMQVGGGMTITYGPPRVLYTNCHYQNAYRSWNIRVPPGHACPPPEE